MNISGVQRSLSLLLLFLFVLPVLDAYAHDGRTDESEVQSSAQNQNYHRKNWRHWIDVDRDCQNTRAEILIRDSEIPVTFRSPRKCVVSRGQWIGPYTGEVFHAASQLDIDHIVPLKHAYEAGGSAWSSLTKKLFANDGENLLAVDASANRQKGAQGPHEWKPSNQGYWCEYARRWTIIKKKYGLTLQDLERTALREMEKTCPAGNH